MLPGRQRRRRCRITLCRSVRRWRDYRSAFLFAAAGLLLGCAVVFLVKTNHSSPQTASVNRQRWPGTEHAVPEAVRKDHRRLTLAMTCTPSASGRSKGRCCYGRRTERIAQSSIYGSRWWFVGLPALLVLLRAPARALASASASIQHAASRRIGAR